MWGIWGITKSSVGMKTAFTANRPEFYWYFFCEWEENFWNDLFSAPKSFLHNGKISLIKNQTYQNIYLRKTSRKYLLICSLVSLHFKRKND